MKLSDVLVVIIILGGIFVWPVIFYAMEKIRDKEKGLLAPVLYLSIYTEIIIVYYMMFRG